MGGLHRSDGGQRPAMCTPVGPAAARPGPAFRPPRAPQRSRESGAEIWVFRACHVREQVGCRFCRGGVVRKARLPFHYRHDTRRFVGQIDLIRQQCAFHRGLGGLPPGFLPVAFSFALRAASLALVSPAHTVPQRGLRSWRAPRQASPTAPRGAPIRRGSTCHREHRPDLRLRRAPTARPLRPSIAPRSYRRARTKARCADWRWHGSWCRPAPPYPSKAMASEWLDKARKRNVLEVSGRWRRRRSAAARAGGDTRNGRR
jgi:hypothetical protein